MDRQDRNDETQATSGLVESALHSVPADARAVSADDARRNDDGRDLLVLADPAALLLDDGQHGGGCDR